GGTPEGVDVGGGTFSGKGRAFNGTGVGFNPMAALGTPRLNARQGVAIDNAAINPTDKTQLRSFDAGYLEIALTPNPVYFINADAANANTPGSQNIDTRGAGYLDNDPQKHSKLKVFPFNPTTLP